MAEVHAEVRCGGGRRRDETCSPGRPHTCVVRLLSLNVHAFFRWKIGAVRVLVAYSVTDRQGCVVTTVRRDLSYREK